VPRCHADQVSIGSGIHRHSRRNPTHVVLALAQSGDEVLYCQLQSAWMRRHKARGLKDTRHFETPILPAFRARLPDCSRSLQLRICACVCSGVCEHRVVERRALLSANALGGNVIEGRCVVFCLASQAGPDVRSVCAVCALPYRSRVKLPDDVDVRSTLPGRDATAMSQLELLIETLWVLDEAGRILSAREPGAPAGPLLSLARGPTGCAWAVRHDVSDALAAQLDELARREPAISDLETPPLYAREYRALLGHGAVFEGPAFTFPDQLELSRGLVLIDDEAQLQKHFRGWVPGEIAEGRAPVVAWVEEGAPVSICFCARLSDHAAEAGLETAMAFRGRGLGARVTAGWALAIRASGRTPLYSTAWSNHASRAVARKLRLNAYASIWNIRADMP
jgi:hypothetical protein